MCILAGPRQADETGQRLDPLHPRLGTIRTSEFSLAALLIHRAQARALHLRGVRGLRAGFAISDVPTVMVGWRMTESCSSSFTRLAISKCESSRRSCCVVEIHRAANAMTSADRAIVRIT